MPHGSPPFRSAKEQRDALDAMARNILAETMNAQSLDPLVDAASAWLHPDAQTLATQAAVKPLFQGFARVVALLASGKAENALVEWFQEHGRPALEALRAAYPRPGKRDLSQRTQLALGPFVRDEFTARDLTALYLLAGGEVTSRLRYTAERAFLAEQKAMQTTLKRHRALIEKERRAWELFHERVTRFDRLFAEMKDRAREAAPPGPVARSRRPRPPAGKGGSR